MFFPNIFGAYDTRDLPNLSVADAGGEAAIMADIRRWADYYNGVVNDYVSLLADVTQKFKGKFGSGGGGGEMQPYTEYGETEATRTNESQWETGFPIRRYRDRQLYTEEYVATKNLDQINKDVVYATIRNYTTRLKMLIRAIVGKTNWTFDDNAFPGSDNGDITIYRLFNADGAEGSLFVNGEAEDVGAIQSYVPSGSDTITINHFALARTKIRDERGMADRLVHIISPSDADTVKGLTGFFPIIESNPLVRITNPVDTVTEPVVTLPRSIGVITNNGSADGEVVVFPFWPAGYTLTLDRSQSKPISIREHALAQFRGFRLIQDETRTAYGEQALQNKRWEYIAGAGVANRGNGVVVQATDGAYEVPSV